MTYFFCQIFGAIASSYLRLSDRFYGTGESCLFSFNIAIPFWLQKFNFVLHCIILCILCGLTIPGKCQMMDVFVVLVDEYPLYL